MSNDQAIRSAESVPFGVTRPDVIPARRYYDPEFYTLECEQLWPHVWQMACRLEEIPEPGDYVEYTNLGQSVLVVRVSATEVKAFNNACRHRGVKLAEGCGSTTSGFVCPFHGWCYGSDGKNTFMWNPESFADDVLDPDDLALTQCRLETWGGCAFINFDDDAAPLRECIEPFASIHDAWKVESLRTEWWLAAKIPVNWKACMEAFMESYHVMETHPQLMPSTPSGKKLSFKAITETERELGLSTTVDSQEFIAQQIHFMQVLGDGMGNSMSCSKDIALAEGLRDMELPADTTLATQTWQTTLNDTILEFHRAAGMDMPDINQLQEEGLNTSVNFCFPHFFLLPSGSCMASYRFRPLGPEETLFELWSLQRYPEGEEPPRATPPEPWAYDDPRWPAIPTQDFANMRAQQEGLHSKGFEFMRLADKREGLIGSFHQLLDGYLAGLSTEQLVPAHHLVNGAIDQPVKDLGL